MECVLLLKCSLFSLSLVSLFWLLSYSVGDACHMSPFPLFHSRVTHPLHSSFSLCSFQHFTVATAAATVIMENGATIHYTHPPSLSVRPKLNSSLVPFFPFLFYTCSSPAPVFSLKHVEDCDVIAIQKKAVVVRSSDNFPRTRRFNIWKCLQILLDCCLTTTLIGGVENTSWWRHLGRSVGEFLGEYRRRYIEVADNDGGIDHD